MSVLPSPVDQRPACTAPRTSPAWMPTCEVLSVRSYYRTISVNAQPARSGSPSMPLPHHPATGPEPDHGQWPLDGHAPSRLGLMKSCGSRWGKECFVCAARQSGPRIERAHRSGLRHSVARTAAGAFGGFCSRLVLAEGPSGSAERGSSLRMGSSRRRRNWPRPPTSWVARPVHCSCGCCTDAPFSQAAVVPIGPLRTDRCDRCRVVTTSITPTHAGCPHHLGVSAGETLDDLLGASASGRVHRQGPERGLMNHDPLPRTAVGPGSCDEWWNTLSLDPCGTGE